MVLKVEQKQQQKMLQISPTACRLIDQGGDSRKQAARQKKDMTNTRPGFALFDT